MRRVRYSVAMSLDGYVAGPNGESDWIVMDPDLDFGALFHSLLDLGLVDTVEVAVIPVLLGGGLPLLPPPARPSKLKLTKHRLYEKTGTVALEYAVK